MVDNQSFPTQLEAVTTRQEMITFSPHSQLQFRNTILSLLSPTSPNPNSLSK
jgi:hypothetical protein